MGIKQVESSNMETRLLIEKNGILEVNGNMYAGSYIRIVKDGHLILDGGFINVLQK